MTEDEFKTRMLLLGLHVRIEYPSCHQYSGQAIRVVGEHGRITIPTDAYHTDGEIWDAAYTRVCECIRDNPTRRWEEAW